ncbi:hypothetical protein AB0A73_21490 [Glycomyces sp. NPDC047369]
MRHMHTSATSRLGRTARVAMLALVASLTAVFAVQSPSMADEDWYTACENDWVTCQTGVTGVAVEGDCMTEGADLHHTSVCVKYDGDYVYVRDGEADGYAAVGRIEYLDTDNKNIRFCRNNSGYGTWARCNFDWNEEVTKDVRAGYKVSSSTVWSGNTLWTFKNN